MLHGLQQTVIHEAISDWREPHMGSGQFPHVAPIPLELMSVEERINE